MTVAPDEMGRYILELEKRNRDDALTIAQLTGQIVDAEEQVRAAEVELAQVKGERDEALALLREIHRQIGSSDLTMDGNPLIASGSSTTSSVEWSQPRVPELEDEVVVEKGNATLPTGEVRPTTALNT